MTEKFIFNTYIKIEAADRDEAICWFDHQMLKINEFVDDVYVADIQGVK
jgi:hypothetical protein